MEEYDLRDVAYEKMSRGYDSQWDLMDDLFAWLDLRLYFFYKHHQWLGPKNDMRNMMGLVVSREEFEHNLAKAAQLGLAAQLTGEEAAQMEASRTAIQARLDRTQANFPLLQLIQRCALDVFEQECVILAYAGALDQKYEKLFAYLQDDITRKAPSPALAVQLFLWSTTWRSTCPALPGGTPSPASLTGSGCPRGSWSSPPRCWSFSAPAR